MDTNARDIARLIAAIEGLRNHLSVFSGEALYEIERLHAEVAKLAAEGRKP